MTIYFIYYFSFLHVLHQSQNVVARIVGLRVNGMMEFRLAKKVVDERMVEHQMRCYRHYFGMKTLQNPRMVGNGVLRQNCWVVLTQGPNLDFFVDVRCRKCYVADVAKFEYWGIFRIFFPIFNPKSMYGQMNKDCAARLRK